VRLKLGKWSTSHTMDDEARKRLHGGGRAQRHTHTQRLLCVCPQQGLASNSSDNVID